MRLLFTRGHAHEPFRPETFSRRKPLRGTIMGMTDSQLYLVVDLPVFAVLMNIIAAASSQHSSVVARFASIDNRFASLENRFDTLTGKVIEIDNRLTRLEAIVERY